MAKQGYIKIYSYMISNLGLSGNSLTVFALINSFCEGGREFNGSEQYLADWLGLSRRSIVRIVNELREKGFVTVENGKYRTISPQKANEIITSDYEQDKMSHVTSCHQNRTKCHTKSDKLTHNNTNYNTTITTTPPPHGATREGKADENPKYRFVTVGHGGFVKMTVEQYAALLNMVDERTLDEYIFRMETLLSVPAKNGTVYVHSPYHTIRKWINEDTAL